MAKKKTTKKKTTKKTTSKGASGTSGGSKKKVRKKTSKKAPARKKAAKKVTKKSTKKKVTKKKSAKKTAKKTPKKTSKKKAGRNTSTKKAAKKTTKKSSKKTAKKTGSKKKSVKKTATRKSSSKTAAKKTSKKATDTTGDTASTAKSSQPDEKAKAADNNSKNTKKRRSSKSKKPQLVMPVRPLLLGPNGPALKPLIPSGKSHQKEESVLENVTSRRKKTPLTKTQLEKYRQLLLQKRAELLGDMRHLEEEALRSDSGRTSHTSQHLDDAGSESYEQSLNLNLAAADRERIVEIDAALERIANRTYGLCELTHEPIKKDRLDEIPWTRYTIEAARELDRRGGRS